MKRVRWWLAGLLALALAAAGVVVLRPGPSDRERELSWLNAYMAWSYEIDAAIDAEEATAIESCQETLVDAPTPRTRTAAKTALAGCELLRASYGAEGTVTNGAWDDWLSSHWSLTGRLVDDLAESAQPRNEPILARAARPLAHEPAKVFCWEAEPWRLLEEEWGLLDEEEFWLDGYADTDRNRIHLAPHVCEPALRFFRGSYAPYLNEESLDLSYALLVLAHEAEHVYHPKASEAAVECVALQNVRGLVTVRGRPPSYAAEMAGLAWDVSYPQNLPEYRSGGCHNGGRQDLRPADDRWP